jgi:maltooligosyltrehalose trehalohydrolase
VKATTRGFFHDGSWSSFRGRAHGHPIDTRIPTSRLVTFSQDHDQIGNRAAGDRLSQSIDEGGLAIAAVLTVLSPFTPMLFMGEEWAASTPWQFFTSHPEPELGRATAEGRIAEFAAMGWDRTVVPDPQDPQTFQRSKLDWAERDRDVHERMLTLYRTLIALRRRVPDLTDPAFGSLAAEADEEARVLRLSRGRTQILVNFAEDTRRMPLPGSPSVLLATADDFAHEAGDAVLPGRSAAVVRVA